jgi:hypothetical protein
MRFYRLVDARLGLQIRLLQDYKRAGIVRGTPEEQQENNKRGRHSRQRCR